MTSEATNEQQATATSPVLPSISQQKKDPVSQKSRRPLNEKIVYRKSSFNYQNSLDGFDDHDHAECPRCHSVISLRRNKNNKAAESDDEEERRSVLAGGRKCRTRLSRLDSSAASLVSCKECKMEKERKLKPIRECNTPPARKYDTHMKRGKLYRSVDPNPNVDWSDLNEKIEDWFEDAKTPDQKVVYHFLNDIKQNDDETSSVYSERYSAKVKSLEGILDNLKKYRHKFQHDSNTGALPQLRSNRKSNDNRLYESSTWRVMRHIRSADVRNKYPLPKANPDEYFRNSTVFHVAGRVPHSTFLLHPEWV